MKRPETAQAVSVRPPPAAPAARMQHIAPFHVMDVIARTRELEAAGRSIVHMEVGEPGFITPAPIIEAGRRALADGLTRYTESKGIAPLRDAIAAHYHRRYGVDVAPERIIVTPGASGALQLATAVLLNGGDQVLMADPCYPCNRHFVRLVDAEPVLLPTDADSAYQPTAAQVDAAWNKKTAALMLASPSNPTGTLLPSATLTALLDLSARRGGRVIMDEIYHGLSYDDGDSDGSGVETTALALSDQTLVVNSFSKYFGMTGWRLGWLVAPPDLVRDCEKLAQNIFISAPTASQYAALAAFDDATMAICEQRRAAFRERRDFLLPALRELGFNIPLVPEGAFYLYADCAALTNLNSYDFAFRLLDQTGVAAAPGRDFGEHRAEQHLRFAYTAPLDQLADGVERLRRFLSTV